jgi:SpoVK/Ycf46/Vps4 family AAA+-type ATPase
MDASVIEAIEAAVAGDPANTALRGHLAGLLIDAERFEEAWNHAKAGLDAAPSDTTLLKAAADAGPRAGYDAEARAYQQLHDALAGTQSATVEPAPANGESVDGAEAPEPTVEPERVPMPATGDVPDSVDDLLSMWDDSEAPAEPEVGELTRVHVTLGDVGGMTEVKKRLHVSFLAPMRNPDMSIAFGKSMRGGLLLWGPPGCGKTYIAKAVAGELGASFYHVGLSDVLDMWIGSSERNLTEIFDVARRNAPCVLFLDEIDALGQKRTQLRGGGGAMRGVVNQLLQEMDGAGSENEGVFVLAATNHPWDIDSALLRPGRLDRKLLVLPPDVEARHAILDLHLRGKPIENLDLGKIAKATDGLTGADLALVCDQATEYAMMDSIESGEVRPITMKDLAKATKEIKPSHLPWIESAKNFALFNNESGTYDELLAWLRANKRK